MTADTLNATLKSRGLHDAALAAGWTPFQHKGRWGWAYPVYNAKLQPYPAKRWKSGDGEAPKYQWLPEKPERAKYYLLPGALSAIEQHHGNCYLAAGEPDVIAYRAAGIENVICWFDGELSVPSTLADDLTLLGVVVLTYAPDRDNTGMVSAHKVGEALKDSAIVYAPVQLPAALGTKYDVNNLWMDSAFEPRTFKHRLDSCPPLDPVDLHLYGQQPPTERHAAAEQVDKQIERWRQDWHRQIMDTMGPPDVVEGTTKRWRCPMPGHDDKHPSFTFRDKGTPGFFWPMCTCGIQERKDAWDALADALNVDSWEDYKATKAAEIGYQRATHSQPSLLTASDPDKPKWVNMRDVYVHLKRELKGEIMPTVRPAIFPLTILHTFGGKARFMHRGKLTAITGISGGGKTLLLKTMFFILLQAGYDCIWWGPEWSPEEYADQDLQRMGGLSMDQLDEWRVWRAFEQAGNVAEMSGRYGLSKPGAAAIQRSLRTIDDLIAIPGQMYVIPDMNMPLQDVCQVAKDITVVKRREGRDVLAFGFDYIQLAQLAGAHDWTWAERVAGTIKTMCSPGEADLCGFVSSQVRKKDSEKARDGEELTQGSAQGLSDAQFNLYLSLTPEFDSDGQKTNAAWLNVQKNSSGKLGKVKVFADWEHLAVLDQKPETKIPLPKAEPPEGQDSTDYKMAAAADAAR